MALSFMEQFNAARRASVPLLAIRTSDIQATLATIATDKENEKAPLLMWDAVRGLTPVNDRGIKLLQEIFVEHKREVWLNPVETLTRMEKKFPKPNQPPEAAASIFPRETVVFFANFHQLLTDPQIIQGIWNLRAPWKKNARMAAFIGHNTKMPPEISSDVIVLHEPRPGIEEMEKVVYEVYDNAELPKPDKQMLDLCTDSIIGLTNFEAETVCAMSIRRKGMDISHLQERKRLQIEQTEGLKVWRGPEMFTGKYGVGGCLNVMKFLTDIANGKERPRCIVFQDEVEKQYAGLRGESSGTTQEMLGMQLSFMQDTDATGILNLGHSGVAKSHIAKAFGNEAGIPTIQLTLGNAKAGLVGKSNENMNRILDVIEAVSQGRALWIATANDKEQLPVEFLARYTFGTFFFDLPTASAREAIWDIYLRRFELSLKNNPKPLDTGWTGREIRNCCLLSYRTNRSLQEAAKNIVPMWKSQEEKVNTLRKSANGRYISADYPGPYKMPEGIEVPENPDMLIAVGVVKGGGRKIRFAEEEEKEEKKDNGKKLVN